MSNQRKATEPQKKILGFADWFFETGCEGVMWILEEDEKTGYDAAIFIGEGDRLKIFAEDGSVAFDGVIVSDREIGWEEFTRNPGHGQPCALGFWIHWTQAGWQPDDWARLFIREKDKRLRAELIKKT